MKVFAFIMAFLVLALTCLPCADGAAVTGAMKMKMEFVKIPAQQDSDDHSDDCSPFCNCSCCACFSVNPAFASIGGPYLDAGSAFISYLPAIIIEMSFPVWQPPRLS